MKTKSKIPASLGITPKQPRRAEVVPWESWPVDWRAVSSECLFLGISLPEFFAYSANAVAKLCRETPEWRVTVRQLVIDARKGVTQ